VIEEYKNTRGDTWQKPEQVHWDTFRKRARTKRQEHGKGMDGKGMDG
jgi:hypothetical protein